MNCRTLIGIAAAATLASQATAQIRGPNEPVPNANAADAAGVNASSPPGRLPHHLAPGMEVRDSTGKRIGSIADIGRSQTGQPAVTVDVDGQRVGVPASDFRVSDRGDYAVSNMTKEQIKAGGSANPG
jgi:hypothetical protein